MTLSIFELETQQEGSAQKSRIVDVTSCMVMMTASFVFCAVFVTTFLGMASVGGVQSFVFIMKAGVFVGIMILASALISRMFEAVLVRRVNAMVLGMVLAFALVLFNL